MSAPTPSRFRRQKLLADKARSAAAADRGKPARVKRDRIPKQVDDALQARAAGRCEMCGQALAGRYQRHHRKLRSQGGADAVANLVLLHPNCHNTAHQNPMWAKEHGWIVNATGNPTTIPITLHGDRPVRLTRDGAYQPVAA